MLRKKQHLPQTSNLIKSKETSDLILQKRNAKVTVQYIQEQPQLIQKPENPHMINQNTTAQDDLEVEYLEENPTADELLEEPKETDEFEDTFYPNAIHCLLDLYKDKYDNPTTDFKLARLWQDIAKDMQESYFEFNDRQVKQKYILLREQYFGLQTREDIENFDYFEQLHNIYKDPGKENILKGSVNEEVFSTCYRDEVLLNFAYEETNETLCHDFKSEEIVHKEHEFIDMVEKELQAIEDGIHNEDKEIAKENGEKCEQTENFVKNEVNVDNLQQKSSTLKRDFPINEITEEPPKRKPKLNDNIVTKEIPRDLIEVQSVSHKDFSLFHYNEHQERRHQEKLSLIEKSIKIQERAMEQQNQLLQELIKRLPS